MDTALYYANNYTKERDLNMILEAEGFNTPLLDWFMSDVNRDDFDGLYARMWLETQTPATAGATYDNQDVPAGGYMDGELVKIRCRELIAIAQLTSQAITVNKGGDTSWGNLMERSLTLCVRDLKRLMEYALYADGTARLATPSAATSTTKPTTWKGADFAHYDTVTAGNTAATFGWAGVKFIRPQQKVDIYAADLSTLQVTGTVLSVNRANNTFVLGSADGYTYTEDDVIYLKDSKDVMPVGLLGIYDDGTSSYMSSFQGYTNSARPDLFKAITDTRTEDWDMTDFDDYVTQAMDSETGTPPDTVFMNRRLYYATKSRVQGYNNFTVVANPEDKNIGVGKHIATIDAGPDQEPIKIKLIQHMPDGMMILADSTKMVFNEQKSVDWDQQYGGIWFPTRGDRKRNLEAWLTTMYNISCRACDNGVVLKGMQDDKNVIH